MSLTVMLTEWHDSDEEFPVEYGAVRPARGVVATAVQIVKHAKIDNLVTEWRKADLGGRRPGPTPHFNEIHVLTLMQVLALIHRATTFTEMQELIAADDGTLAELIGYEPPTGSEKAIYAALYNTYRRFLKLIDPAPEPLWKIISNEELCERVKVRDPERVAELRRRGHEFLNRMLYGTWMLLPRPVRRRYKGDVVIDATIIRAACSPRARDAYSTLGDPEAGMYVRDGDHNGERAINDARKHRRKLPKVIWGRETHTLVAYCPDWSIPRITLTATLDNPGVQVSRNAMDCVEALESIYDLPAGHFVGDRAYLPHSKTENLVLPLRAKGYIPVFDYDRTATDLGIQASNGGAILVDGTWYCPSMPEALRDASIHHLVAPRTSPDWIDETTYEQRLEQRARYALHTKERADHEGYVRRQCPAVGHSATVTCPRRDPHPKVADRPRARVLPLLLVNPAPRVCEQQTMTFGPAGGAKHEQRYPYRSPEWKRWYAPMRNTVESNNKSLKDGRFGALDDAERRPRRGWAAMLVVLAMVMAATNVRKIVKWREEHPERPNLGQPAPKVKRARRRDRTHGYTIPDPDEQAQAPPLSA